MARAFRKRGGRFTARLQEVELDLLRSLIEQTGSLLASVEPVDAPPRSGADHDPVEALVQGMQTALSGPGEDPALQRLLPDAHRDDPIAAAEFRLRSGDTVRSTKLQRLQRVTGVLAQAAKVGDGALDLDRDEAADLLIGLTDVRLVLGERLDLRSDEDADAMEELDHDDPRAPLVSAYGFLTWLQEGLGLALSR